MTRYFADAAWLPHGFAPNVRIDVEASASAGGRFSTVDEDAGRAETQYLGRFVLPGMPNLHSHAFQRAMAGLAERRGFAHTPEREAQKAANSEDSFWTWRETMYAFAGCVDPDALRAIAAQLYVEMLKAGYTHVCEFHYLHHQSDGKPHADPAAMSIALIEAAREVGIGLTLLPTLYMSGGFDRRALSERQRRFGHDVEAYLRLLEQLRKMEDSTLRIGVALHSLRAVPEEAMDAVLDAVSLAERAGNASASLPPRTESVSSSPPPRAGTAPSTLPQRSGTASFSLPPRAGEGAEGGWGKAALRTPIHIHIAEQIGEVQDCLALRNARPVEWLLDHAPVDARWCLVHATHMTPEETRRVAESGAVTGLCPTTEANLGDGLFPLQAYLAAGGALGIGSDSHISISPVEELRWLEYGQRLLTRHRNIAVSESSNSVGETLWGDALFGGTQASGMPIGSIEVADPAQASGGPRADLLVLDDDSPQLASRDAHSVLDTFIFAGNTNLVRHVMVNGDWVVRDFRHRDEERIAARYRETAKRLADAL